MATKEAIIATTKQPGATLGAKRTRPTNEEIAVRAYEIFLMRGGENGSDVEDWLRAEQELR